MIYLSYKSEIWHTCMNQFKVTLWIFFNKIGDGHTGGPGWLGMEWPSSMSMLLASGWLEWYLQASPGIFNNSCHCPHNNWNWPNNGEKDLSIQRQIDSLATHLINVTHFLKGYSLSWNKGIFLDLFHLISCKKIFKLQ